MSRQPPPKPGDIWEVRIPGKRITRKTVGQVSWRWCYHSVKQLPSGKWVQPNPRRLKYVDWRRMPGGRYSGIWLDDLLQYGKRVDTAARIQARYDALPMPRTKADVRRELAGCAVSLAKRCRIKPLIYGETASDKEIKFLVAKIERLDAELKLMEAAP